MEKVTQKSGRTGRPRSRPGTTYTKPVLVRLTPAMYKRMTAAAKRAGKPLTTWIRDAATEKLNQE